MEVRDVRLEGVVAHHPLLPRDAHDQVVRVHLPAQQAAEDRPHDRLVARVGLRPPLAPPPPVRLDVVLVVARPCRRCAPPTTRRPRRLSVVVHLDLRRQLEAHAPAGVNRDLRWALLALHNDADARDALRVAHLHGHEVGLAAARAQLLADLLGESLRVAGERARGDVARDSRLHLLPPKPAAAPRRAELLCLSLPPPPRTRIRRRLWIV